MPKTGTWTMHCSIHAESDANGTFTNQPAADTFLFNSHRHVTLVDVTGFQQVRLKVNKQGTAGNTGATLRVGWSSTFSTTVGSYADLGVSPVSVAIDTVNAFLDSGWVDLNPDVFATGDDDIFVCVIGNGGNGTIDPLFGNISISFR